MRLIKLTKNQAAMVDDDAFDDLVRFKWHLVKGYATRNVWKKGKRVGVEKMHRRIIACPPDLQVDHINGDKLDNRLANLRKCLSRENTVNSKLRCDNKSGHRGVFWKDNRWLVRIGSAGKRYHLGRFREWELAVLVYMSAAEELHGEFIYGSQR